MLILETKRLILREFKEEDVPFLYEIFSDAHTMAYYPAPFTFEKTQNWVKKSQDRYQKDGYGLWAVCLKETQKCIGDCGLVKQEVDGRTEVEIGYHINKNYWSRGFASEAAKACKEYGFNDLNIDKLISIIDPRNTASVRVAEKIGLNKEKESIIFEKMHDIYSALK